MDETLKRANEVERCLALEAIIAHAPDTSIEEAIEKFGGPLTVTEKRLLNSLTRDEFKALRTIKGKVGGMLRKGTINNNTNSGDRPNINNNPK